MFKILSENHLELIKNLFEQAYEREFSYDILKWALFKNIKDKSYSCGIIENNKLVAHNAFIPYEFKLGSMLIKALLSISSASIKPGYFPLVYKNCEKCFFKDFDIIFAFPNKNSAPFFIKKFGFNKGHFNMMGYDKKKKPLIKRDLDYKIPLKSFLFNSLSKDFLKWRLFSHPYNNYYVFKGRESKIYYKKYDKDSLDIIAVCPDKKNNFTIKSILEFIENFNNNINIISTNEILTSFLLKTRFEIKNTNNIFAYKLLNNKLKNYLNFFLLQMIDNDIY